MSLWLDKLQVLVCNKISIQYHYLFLENSSLNSVNRCYPKISPTKLRLEFRSTRYSTNTDHPHYTVRGFNLVDCMTIAAKTDCDLVIL